MSKVKRKDVKAAVRLTDEAMIYLTDKGYNICEFEDCYGARCVIGSLRGAGGLKPAPLGDGTDGGSPVVRLALEAADRVARKFDRGAVADEFAKDYGDGAEPGRFAEAYGFWLKKNKPDKQKDYILAVFRSAKSKLERALA